MVKSEISSPDQVSPFFFWLREWVFFEIYRYILYVVDGRCSAAGSALDPEILWFSYDSVPLHINDDLYLPGPFRSVCDLFVKNTTCFVTVQ